MAEQDVPDVPWFRGPLPSEPGGWASAPLGAPWAPGRRARVRDLRALDEQFLGEVLAHYVPAAAALLNGPLRGRMRAAGYDQPDEPAADIVLIAASRYDPAVNDRFGAYLAMVARRLAGDASRHAAAAAAAPDGALRPARDWLAAEAAAHLPPRPEQDPPPPPGGTDRDRLMFLLRPDAPDPAPQWPSAGPDLAGALPGRDEPDGDDYRAVRFLGCLGTAPDALAEALPDGHGLVRGAHSLGLRLFHGAFTPDGPPGPRTGRRVHASRWITDATGARVRAGGSPVGRRHGLSGPLSPDPFGVMHDEARALGLLRLCLSEVRGDACLLCADPACDTLGHHADPPDGAPWVRALADRSRRAVPVPLDEFVRDAFRRRR